MIKGSAKVFSFTLHSQVGTRGYRIATILVALLLLIAIPGVMLFADADKGDAAQATAITMAVHIDGLDYAPLSYIDAGIFAGVRYESAATIEEAAALCAGNRAAVIIEEAGGVISVILPEGTEVPASDAEAFGGFLAAVYPFLATSAGGVMPAYAASMAMTAPSDLAESARAVLAMILPYVVMMLLYFMVLIYGQGVANSVITEKTSRLMDLFLVSVKPGAMILGKTLAVALAGIIQTCVWIGAAVGGFALGAWLVRLVNPQSTLGILSLFDMLGSLTGLFTPAGFAVAIAIIIAGFLLYCALAGIGGAMAGKPEDLSTTNIMFTIVLVASFFACIFTGDSAGMVSTNPILGYIPFTAILVAPSRVLLGDMTIAQGLISLMLIAALAFLLTIAAGKVYTMMAFYRGNPPTPAKMLRILRSGARER